VCIREYRESVVRLASEHNASIGKIASKLGIVCGPLRRWKRSGRRATEPPVPKQPDLHQRARQLEAENQQP
jgi:transposase-like protein